jgi:hypothetical protein
MWACQACNGTALPALLPENQFVGADEGQQVPLQLLLICLDLLAGTYFCWNSFLTTEEGHIKMFRISL